MSVVRLSHIRHWRTINLKIFCKLGPRCPSRYSTDSGEALNKIWSPDLNTRKSSTARIISSYTTLLTESALDPRWTLAIVPFSVINYIKLPVHYLTFYLDSHRSATLWEQLWPCADKLLVEEWHKWCFSPSRLHVNDNDKWWKLKWHSKQMKISAECLKWYGSRTLFVKIKYSQLSSRQSMSALRPGACTRQQN